MNVHDFIRKWERVDLSERSASQQHFLDLCEVLEHPKPAEADPSGESFTFEKGAAKQSGGDGWADVWKKGYFAWEYKGRHKDLDAAYGQLLQYRESLENPPLLVVSDMDRFRIHTNFTGTVKRVHEIALADLAKPDSLKVLHSVFFDPEALRPGRTNDALTEEAAATFAELSQSLRSRGHDSQTVAHFLDRLVFCLFAEDVDLLPADLFSRLLEKSREQPDRFAELLKQLFRAMATGGNFGLDDIRWFNGNLYADETVLEMTAGEIDLVRKAARYDWSEINPSIFGTLFERGLDPNKRSQLGAHYTSYDDIETIVEPVIMKPLRREWEETRATVETLLATGKKKATPAREGAGAAKRTPAQRKKAVSEASEIIRAFLERLSHVTILDPACGSGNFLYVSLQKLKDLEKEAMLFAAERGLGAYMPYVGPWQLYGIEINPYAFDLAQMTIWIGHLQWTRRNGYGVSSDPVLRPLSNFHNMDAILGLSDPANPKEPEWPRVDFIVGNPPFLGGKKMRAELGNQYVDTLFRLWGERVPREADLCCYWFEKARKQIEDGKCHRAGRLATQGIRGGANRKVVAQIKETGDVFFAESDRPWVLDGANVHVSMIGFDNGDETERVLDGAGVGAISTNLASCLDITDASRLPANANISFMGTTKLGPFEIAESVALGWLARPNPHGRPNSDILRPWLNGVGLTTGDQSQWIIDCGTDMQHEQFVMYEGPYEYARERVKPERDRNNRAAYREKWWLHGEARSGMRRALCPLERFIATPRVAKHRIFVWLRQPMIPDSALIAFARSDDYFFGVLHSRVHELWARAQGTQLRERESGFRYTPTTCFETFALPEPTGAQRKEIAATAKELDTLRNNWLNPPEWTREQVLEFPGSVDGPWARYVTNAGANGIGTVRYPRIVAKDAECAKRLAKRTLTNLCNERPSWLDMIHRRLDAAVLAAYGWNVDIADDVLLEKLLALNLERAAVERISLKSGEQAED